ncbi:MAG: hypothetical protein QM739_10380 [Propionivibrio sp.]
MKTANVRPAARTAFDALIAAFAPARVERRELQRGMPAALPAA